MSALLLLLALAAMYVGIIETAFSALMRLSLRLMAERGGRSDRLGYYLDDPIQLFVPARLLLGLIFSLATVVIAVLTGRTGFNAIGMLLLFVAVFILLFEHVLPMLIVRRNPERVLEFVLPPFDYVARALHPLTGTLVRLLVEARRDRQAAQATTVSDEEAGEAAHAYLEAGEEQGLIERDERRLLQSITGDGFERPLSIPQFVVTEGCHRPRCSSRRRDAEEKWSRLRAQCPSAHDQADPDR